MKTFPSNATSVSVSGTTVSDMLEDKSVFFFTFRSKTFKLNCINNGEFTAKKVKQKHVLDVNYFDIVSCSTLKS